MTNFLLCSWTGASYKHEHHQQLSSSKMKNQKTQQDLLFKKLKKKSAIPLLALCPPRMILAKMKMKIKNMTHKLLDILCACHSTSPKRLVLFFIYFFKWIVWNFLRIQIKNTIIRYLILFLYKTGWGGGVVGLPFQQLICWDTDTIVLPPHKSKLHPHSTPPICKLNTQAIKNSKHNQSCIQIVVAVGLKFWRKLPSG